MSLSANPHLKQNQGKDAIDLSIESNKRYLIDNLLKKNNVELDQLYIKFDNLNYDKNTLNRENSDLKKTNEYINNSNDTYIKKISELKVENTELKEDNNKLKRKIIDCEKSFENYLEKTKKK
jgi:cell division protein FtsB